ncbi:FUSC family protein [Peterkaempfera sp. SMS 1(5)a]|uniref:FUSC family protein n=1 Tax=Peterkaempfera podocarpi TaxID=3232308 RepID=UPI00366E2896
MPVLPDPPPAEPGRSRRASVADAACVLSPRGALALHRVDGALLFALRAALAMALPALPLALTGRTGPAVYAMLGAFTATFGRNLPYPRRARVLAVTAVAMTACVGCGSALAAVTHPQTSGPGTAVVVVATAVVAGLAKFACGATRLGGLGAVLLLFSFAVAANGSPAPADVAPQTALAAIGAATAWVLAMPGWLVHPDRPQRLAVATALRELAALLEEADVQRAARTRHRATVGILEAYLSLGLAPPTAAEHGERRRQGGTCVLLTDLSWSLLVCSVHRSPGASTATPQLLHRQAGLLAVRRRRPPVALPELLSPSPVAAADVLCRTAGTSAAAGPVARRAAELVVGRGPAGPVSGVALVVPALRMFLGTAVAGGVAALLGLGHGYWAAITAAAVLHSVNVRTTAQRAVQRTLGTVSGLLLALGVLAGQPDPLVLVLVVVVLEFLLEYGVALNYGLAVVFVTPLALLMSELTSAVPARDLVYDRGLSSILGIAAGLACALLVVHGQAAVRVERAFAACTAAAERAEHALADGAWLPVPVVQVQLAVAVVELHEADDAAAGELWQAEIDPAVLAATEQRAYVLLDRLLHGR